MMRDPSAGTGLGDGITGASTRRHRQMFSVHGLYTDGRDSFTESVFIKRPQHFVNKGKQVASLSFWGSQLKGKDGD